MVVVAVVFTASIAVSVLYILSQRQLSGAASVSPLTRRWLRLVASASLASFVCALGIALGLGHWWADLFSLLPLWRPCLFIFVHLRRGSHKRGLALAVAMGGTLFFAIVIVRSVADDWGASWQIRDLLALAPLAPLIMAAGAIRAYYTPAPRTRRPPQAASAVRVWPGASKFIEYSAGSRRQHRLPPRNGGCRPAGRDPQGCFLLCLKIWRHLSRKPRGIGAASFRPGGGLQGFRSAQDAARQPRKRLYLRV